MFDNGIDDGQVGADLLLPLEVPHGRVYVTARRLASQGDESEIGFRPPALEDLLDTLGGVAKQMGERLRGTGASKLTVEFGCEFGVESGKVVAILGKTSGKSAFKIGLEWSGSKPQP